jgi:hypothetical protein
MMTTKTYFIAIMLFCLFSLFRCGSQSLRSKVQFPDYLPESLIITNYQDADMVAAILIDTIKLSSKESIYSDSGAIGYATFIYYGNVFHTYKGKLEKGKILFKHLQEYDKGLIERVNKQRPSKIVFLKRGNKKREYVAPQFTVFSYTKELHKALIEYSKND